MPSGHRQVLTRTPGAGSDVVYVVPPFAVGLRLDAYLSRLIGEHSRAEWQRLIEGGIVLRNGRAARPADRVQAGDRLTVRPIAQHVLAAADPSITLDVVYEDDAMIVVNKPAGLVVHPAPGHEEGTLVNALLARYPQLRDPSGAQRPGIVHRLDKDTSGLIMIGRTLEAVADLQRQMQADETIKRYYLLVLGDLTAGEGLIDAPIGRDPRNRQRMAVRAGGRPAQTRFRVVERFGTYTLVDALLCTGRTHQLRVHFAYIGHPVAADRTYGSGRRPPGLTRQFVHAYHLEARSPATGERIVLDSPLPPDLAEPLERLRAEQRRAPSAAATRVAAPGGGA
ncbi:MAG TPA: RluA family pseudouridine synthase [Chloroflexota bacterium]|nr:RluA family pseudouridine synthase [Chloroflexota bacterium]